MSNLRNKVQLIGRLGSDPEVMTLESGKRLAKFTMATNEYFTNADGEKGEDTQWHNVVIWGRLADVVEKYLKKGNEIAVEGKLTHQKYEDKGGVNRVSTEVIVHDLQMLGSKSS